MQIRSPHAASPALAASVVALAHRDDFTQLGATDVTADGTGIAVTFATPHQGDVAQAVVNEAFLPEVDGRVVPIPFRAAPTSSDVPGGAPVGVDDVRRAVELLPGVTRVAVLDAASTIFVGTADAKSARRLDGLLRDSVLGFDVIVDVDGRKDTRGWGDGIG